ncbi:MAG: bifunctional phosphoribosyl-AMP cyclohydrolase/phosphoribosyl-ATP diphosphatase HisIE [Bacteroidota bacterium]
MRELSQINFDKMPDGLVPAVVQDHNTDKVLMLGYMNAEALAATQTSGFVIFFSRSKQRLWQKGESSGNTLAVISMSADCDQDAILIKAQPKGPVCHTGDDTCWGEENKPANFLNELENIVRVRMQDDPEKSYTARLVASGLPKVAQKVGEEAVETIIEALVDNREKLLEESADLLFHLLVLFAVKEVRLEEVEEVLRRRNRPKVS